MQVKGVGLMEEGIKNELRESIAVKEKVIDENTGVIKKVAEKIIEAYRNKGKVVVCGCGGSAADAQHIVAEFMGKYKMERAPMAAVALTVNASSLTAIANDYSFDDAFARQMEGLVNSGDVAIGISTSGNSECIIRALQKAKEGGAFAVAFTGEGGGKIKEVADVLIAVPSKDTPRIQEAHITIGHIICGIVERECNG